MQIQEALATFVVQLRANGRSEHTVRQYQRHVRALERFLKESGHSLDVAEIPPEVLARFLTSPAVVDRAGGGRRRATSANAMRTSLRCIFAHLHAAGLITANPARLIRRAMATPPPPHPIADDDLRKLLEVTGQVTGVGARRDHILIRLLSESGMRIGSAVGLDVDDLDLVAGDVTLRNAKGGATQTAVLPPRLCDALRSFVGDRRSGALFVGRNGRRLTARHVQRTFSKLLKTAGVVKRVTLHSLRHGMAMRLYRATGDLGLVRKALGHASIASTAVYAQADATRLRAALR